MFHTIVSIKNDGHYFCRAGGNRPDGLNEPVTCRLLVEQLLLLVVSKQRYSDMGILQAIALQDQSPPP
ncbi:hypothetical protein EI062_16420 [Escherichia coli]|nr:hypothetical protein [Escherichia coli]